MNAPWWVQALRSTWTEAFAFWFALLAAINGVNHGNGWLLLLAGPLFGVAAASRDAATDHRHRQRGLR